MHFEFRPSGCAWSIILPLLAVFPILTILSFRVASPLWQRILLSALTILSVLAIIELVMRVAFERVDLSATGITCTSLKSLRRKRTFIPRADIQSVTWNKGAGVFLKLVDGRWMKLPEVGRTYQGLTNSIRAWLKRSLDSGSVVSATSLENPPSD